MSNYLVIQPDKINELPLDKNIKNLIPKDITMNGKTYELYTLPKPELLKDIKQFGKTEKMINYTTTKINNFDYVQNIYKSYLSYLIKNIKNILISLKKNKNVQKLLNILDNIFDHDEQFYDKFYNILLDFFIDKKIINIIDVKHNTKTYSNYFYEKIFMKSKENIAGFNIYDIIQTIFVIKIIIDISVINDNKFRMNLNDKIFLINSLLTENPKDSGANTKKLLKNFESEKFEIQYDKNSTERARCINVDKIIKMIDNDNYKKLKNIIVQNGILLFIINLYIVMPLILIYNKDIVYKILCNIEVADLGLYFQNINQNSKCYYNINDSITNITYYPLVPKNLLSLVEDNKISNMLESLNKLFYIKCEFTKDLNYIDISFDNNVLEKQKPISELKSNQLKEKPEQEEPKKSKQQQLKNLGEELQKTQQKYIEQQKKLRKELKKKYKK